MPINPEYIPLPKSKEMFAIASWRDSPGLNATPAAHPGVSGSPHLASLDALRNGKGMAGIKDAAKSKAPLAAAAGKKKKRKPASGATTSTASAAGSGARPDDVDDFFVHILLPSCVSVQTLEFELQAQTTPLKSIEVGLPKVLFPRKPAGGAGGDASLPTTTALASAVASAKIVSSPSCAPAVNAANNELSLPLMCLPPADLPEPAPKAEKTVTFVQRRWPTAAVSLASRSRSVLNSTLVLKGMPNQAKTETVLTEMQNLPHTPSYVRLLRSERGVFKGVVFVKYANCEVAEECKLRLEKFVLGSRPLKVEFKKKSTAAASVNAAITESKRSLQELVRELRVSAEHEGFHLSRTDVAKEALKVLKQLCQSYGLLFDMNDQQVTVRRVLGHWKDIRSQASTLGIMRPLGPEDGKPAFSAGRGRPL
ncbi:hypothetical protein CGC20_12005 [Leishmania donovani]|uniref:RRM domain-containing protein n=1 Tax=Leishmania donovani TaxID=5661 RepID=A0A504X948_LEIDO|nr:hypothetical protein CGC20_12005 [Leishmania donovani]